MIVLWFIASIALAFAIARYNESNKLFWCWSFALIFGFASAVLCIRTLSNKQSSDNSAQVYAPTQESISTTAALQYYNVVADLTPEKVTGSNPVGQVYAPEQSEVHATLSKVFGRTRDQPPFKMLKPPEWLNVEFFNTS